MNRPKLSIVVGTVDPWQDIRICLEALMEQIDPSRMELILADGLGLGLPYLGVLSLCHSAGEGLGYAQGPGNSPYRIR